MMSQVEGIDQVTLFNEEGGSVSILRNGARVIDVRAAQDQPSALWVNPSDHHWNVGGERTWISPELDFFKIDGTYRVPESLDPGYYRLERQENAVKASQELALYHARSGADIHISLTKTYSLLDNPLSMSGGPDLRQLTDVAYIGYRCSTELKYVKPPAQNIACNAWSIAQVPAGGVALVPTIGRHEPVIMFQDEGCVPMNQLDQGFQVAFEGDMKFKLSVDVANAAGRIGYVRRVNERETSLYIRQFPVNLSGYYPDYPSGQLQFRGSCIQLFFDGHRMGGFGELEYHAPAISLANPHSVDHGCNYYYVGDHAAIERISKGLLGMCS